MARSDDRVEAGREPIEVLVEGRLEAPFAEVRAALLDLRAFGRWFPAMADWRVLEDWGDARRAQVYGRQWLPWPIAHRDYVVEYAWRDSEVGFELEARALADAAPEPPRGVVRIEAMRTRWRVAPSEGGTAVHYHFEGDIGGRLPRWAANAGWRRSTPRLIEALRSEVDRRLSEASIETR